MQELKMIRKNPTVCFEVGMMTDMKKWQSLIVYEKFEALKERKQRMQEIFFLAAYFH